MAREFGKRSYNPEALRFTSSGSRPDGLPWRAVDRKIPVNILCQASGNPSTAEELAMELGIALPYMEYELNVLERATLIKKLDTKPVKYITNFYIASLETQNEIFAFQREGSAEGDELVPDIAIYEHGNIKASRELILSTEPGRILLEKIKSLYSQVREILKKCTNPILHETLGYYASTFMYDTLGMALNDLVDAGKLEVPVHDSRVGIYMIVKL